MFSLKNTIFPVYVELYQTFAMYIVVFVLEDYMKLYLRMLF